VPGQNTYIPGGDGLELSGTSRFKVSDVIASVLCFSSDGSVSEVRALSTETRDDAAAARLGRLGRRQHLSALVAPGITLFVSSLVPDRVVDLAAAEIGGVGRRRGHKFVAA